MPLTTAILLSRGRSEKIVTAATATGTDFSQQFVLPVDSAINCGMVTFQAVPTGGFTGLEVNLELSLDGVNFSTAETYLAMHTTPVQWTFLNGGSIRYRLNITTFTNGTSVDVFVSLG
jgi:hypothetical protein